MDARLAEDPEMMNIHMKIIAWSGSRSRSGSGFGSWSRSVSWSSFGSVSRSRSRSGFVCS